jgi:hypothetical protein
MHDELTDLGWSAIKSFLPNDLAFIQLASIEAWLRVNESAP